MGIVFFLVWLVLAVICIMDINKHSESAWQSSGQNKVLWIVLVILLGFIGEAIYWFAIRPKVAQTA